MPDKHTYLLCGCPHCGRAELDWRQMAGLEERFECPVCGDWWPPADLHDVFAAIGEPPQGLSEEA